MKSWIEVSTQRLAGNYYAARTVTAHSAGPDAAVLAVVKANAYGHGAALCAPELVRAGAVWLGVTDAVEGAAVRAAIAAEGLEQSRILVMCGHLPIDAPAIVEHSLTPVVWNDSQLASLAAVAGSKMLPIHLEIDTGMCRQGIPVGDELRELLYRLADKPSVHLDGVLTHFASAEVASSAQTASQRERFEAAIQMVLEAGLRPAWVHAGNTSALDNAVDGGTLPWLRRQAGLLGAQAMVREGLGLYGYCLPLERLVASDGEGASRLRAAVLPVMTWKTRVLAVSAIEAGARVGYNGTFVAETPMRLALLPIGYADGLRRELSSSTGNKINSGGWVMIGGRRARIVGRISMNLTTVNVTGIDGVAAGDEVVLLGEGITAEDHAALAGTIPYEILCGVRAAFAPGRCGR